MGIEGVLLTGGKGSRMGSDKGTTPFAGRPLAEIVAAELAEVCTRVTALGRSPLPGHEFLEDQESFAGPLTALSRFRPMEDFVFVASCDLPLFRGSAVQALASMIGDADAAVPVVDGRPQPLCALYRGAVFAKFAAASERGERSITRAFGGLTVCFVDESDLSEAGIPIHSLRGANTPEELEALKRMIEPQET